MCMFKFVAEKLSRSQSPRAFYTFQKMQDQHRKQFFC